MLTRALLPTGTALLYVACATSGGPSSDGTLAYDVPSPPTALYHVADSMVIGVTSPVGTMEITGNSFVALDLSFTEGEGGVRVHGNFDGFEGSMNNPMTGIVTADAGDLNSTEIEFVLDRRGGVEVISAPELAGPAAQLSPFQSIANEFFPRLPERAVQPGDMWVDTVTWSVTVEAIETTSSTVYTYTLVGDTLVDGRTLLNIAVSGEATTEAEMEQGGMSMTQNLSGTTSGLVLWDAQRGLFTHAALDRAMSGTTSVAGMGSFDMTLEGPSRIRLQN